MGNYLSKIFNDTPFDVVEKMAIDTIMSRYKSRVRPSVRSFHSCGLFGRKSVEMTTPYADRFPPQAMNLEFQTVEVMSTFSKKYC